MKTIVTLAALLVTISCLAQKKAPARACFSDADITIDILTPALINKKAYLDRELVRTKAHYGRLIDSVYQHKGISINDYRKLKNIGIAISDVNNSLGMTRSDSIYIDKGLIIAIDNYAFAEAMLESGRISSDLYTRWHYYFIDAVIKGDPVTYCTGTTYFNEQFSNLMNSDTKFNNVYQAVYNSWIAFILLHEASHILLKHIDKWQQKYPAYTNANLGHWHEEQFKYSQAQELEADNLFMQLYMNSARLDPSYILSSCGDWFILRESFYQHNGYTLYLTHPGTVERFSNLAGNMAKYLKMSADDLAEINNKFNAYYASEHQKIMDDQVPDVPKLSNERPAGIDEHIERFSVRDSQLKILFDNNGK
jgi:hypothetical protein